MAFPPFDPCCPRCGHEFTLADLKKMAVGDGWQRFFLVRRSDGAEMVVSFDEFEPLDMVPIERRVSSALTMPPAANSPSTGETPAKP